MKAQKRNKYGNRKTEINGIKFDSKKEAERYLYLRNLERSGEISNLHLQEKFCLQRPYVDSQGRKVERIDYVADFTYICDGQLQVEDVKSKVTAKNSVYVLKKKLMADKGYFIKEV